MTRVGRTNDPKYRLVAIKSEARRDGKPIAFLGAYNPATKEVTLKSEEIKKFIGNGAQPSRTVLSILRREGIVE